MTGALVVAIISLCVAVASLTWNVVSFLFTGARVRVVLEMGATRGPAYFYQPAKGWSGIPQSMLEQGFNEECAFVIVRNRGRAPVTVKSYAVAFETGQQHGMVAAPSGQPQIPFRLDGYDEVMWPLDMHTINLIADLHGRPQVIRAVARLATGRAVISREEYVLTAQGT